MAQANKRAVQAQTTSDRLHEAFPEIDFQKIVEKRGTFNHHNLGEKWDALCRQIDWWLEL